MRPFFQTASLAAAFALAFGSTASADPVFVDSFDDGDVRHSDQLKHFWSVNRIENNHDSSAFERNGRLHLVAASWANTYIGVVGPTMESFGFFKKPVTVALDEIQLAAVGIDAGEARFKVSFTSIPERAEQANDAISLRIRPGLLLLGYRIDGFNTSASPENLSGDRPNSVLVQELSATPTRLTLTLGPADRPGMIRYTVTADGNGVSVNRTGVFPLTQSQWGNLDAASLVLDARRDNGTTTPGTQTEFSVGRITVTR